MGRVGDQIARFIKDGTGEVVALLDVDGIGRVGQASPPSGQRWT